MLKQYDDETLVKVKNAAIRSLNKEYSDSMARIAKECGRELRKRHAPEDFQPISLDDYRTSVADYVMCVHEGVCPKCGRLADVIETYEMEPVTKENAPDWLADWMIRPVGMQMLEGMKITCRMGHTATVEPNETRTDWVAW